MKPISEWTGKVCQGHVLDLLHEMPDDSVDMILTSPPYYGLRSYGEETKVDWPDGWHGQLGLEENVDLYVEHLMMVFRELKRVLKPSGSFYLNIGDTYATSLGKHGGETAGMSKESMVGDEARPPKPPAPRLGKLLIPSRVALRMIADGWMCPDEIIWRKPNCLAAHTRMYARVNGKPIRAPLDEILRLNGTIELPSFDSETKDFRWTRVTWIMPGVNPALRIAFDDGTNETITEEHELPLSNGKLVRVGDLKPGDEVLNLSGYPIGEDAAAVYDFDMGYFIGVFLAEGNLLSDRDGAQFALHAMKDLELAAKIETIVTGRLGENLTRFIQGNNLRTAVSSSVVSSIITKFVTGAVAKDKSLRRDILFYGKPFLEGILSGFLDGDGHWDAQNSRWRVGITRNESLLADLRFICRVLGHRLRSSEGFATAAGRRHPIFRIEIRKNVGMPTKTVRSVSLVPPMHNYDVEVDNPSHLFATESGLVVHNHMPSSVKNRLANSWEPIFRFVKNDRALLWRVFRDHGDYKAGTWLRTRPSTPYREWMLREDWGGFKAGEWVPKKPPKPLQARSRTNWLGFAYFYELDAIREPHKTTTHARFAGGGMDGPRVSSKSPVGQETIEASRSFGYGSKLYDYHTNPAGKVPDDVDEYSGKYAEDPESVNSPRARTARPGYEADTKFYAEGGKNPGDVLMRDDHQYLTHPENRFGDSSQGKNPGDSLEDTKGMNVPGQEPQHGLRVPGHQGDRGHESGKNPGDVAEAGDVWQEILMDRAEHGGGAQREAYNVYVEWKRENPARTYEQFFDEVSSAKISTHQDMKWGGIDSKQTAWGNYAAYLHLPNPKGRHPDDVQEDVKERIGDAHKGWATTNLYMPHVTHHDLGKNPGDVAEPKYEEARRQPQEGRLQLPTGSWPGNAQGWWKTDVPRTTHPLGRAPEDVMGEHREKDDDRVKLDHLALPPEPEVDPSRAFSEGGKNPGDTVSESKYSGTELEASHLGTGRNPNIGLMKELGMVRSEKSGALGIDLSGKNPGDVYDAEGRSQGSNLGEKGGLVAKQDQSRPESRLVRNDGKNPGDSVETHPDPETDPEGYAKWYFEDREKQAFHQHEADAVMGFGQQKRGQKIPTLPHPYGTAPEDTLDAGPEVRPKEKLGGPSRWQKGELHPTLDPTGRFHHEGGKNPGDFWELTTQPFKGAHFAVFPLSICWNPILSSSPGKVCGKCGKILGVVSRTSYVPTRPSAGEDPRSRNEDRLSEARGHGGWQGNNTLAMTQVLGPADCGCNDEVEGGVVLDPFAGSATVAEAVEILNILGKKPAPDELRELRAELAKGQKPLAKAAARRWIMLELSPAYCAIAENRLRPYR